MGSLLLDTHAWAWSMISEDLLSASARRAIATADAVYVSPISFFEIGQKVRVGKWAEMVPFTSRLLDLVREQGVVMAPLTPEICLRAGLWEWAHRDPFDRLLAATSEIMTAPLVTADPVFDGLGRVHRIW
jgi:PIN domain nuclease of toxin-antitoxin system